MVYDHLMVCIHFVIIADQQIPSKNHSLESGNKCDTNRIAAKDLRRRSNYCSKRAITDQMVVDHRIIHS